MLMSGISSQQYSPIISRQCLCNTLSDPIDSMPIYSFEFNFEWFTCFNGFFHGDFLRKTPGRVHRFSFRGVSISDSSGSVVQGGPENITVSRRFESDIGAD